MFPPFVGQYQMNGGTLRQLVGQSQPWCIVTKNANQELSSGTLTDLTWETDDYDFWGMHDTSSNTDRITLPFDGLYVCFAGLQWESDATGKRDALFQINNAVSFGRDMRLTVGAGTTTCMMISSFIPGDAGEYIRVQAVHGAAGALDVQSSTRNTYFGAVRIGGWDDRT